MHNAHNNAQRQCTTTMYDDNAHHKAHHHAHHKAHHNAHHNAHNNAHVLTFFILITHHLREIQQ